MRPGHTVLDLAGGTGDLAIKFSKIVGDSGQVVLADINDAMLAVGRDRLFDAGCAHNTQVAQVNAEALPFEDNTFNTITIAFGLRNVTDKDKALRSHAARAETRRPSAGAGIFQAGARAPVETL